MKKWYVTVLVVFVIALATAVFAAPPDPGPQGAQGPAGFGGPHGPGGFHQMFASYLNLSKEQIDKMAALRSRYYSETRDLRYELAQKELEMRKLFTDSKVDDKTLLAKQRELNALRSQLMDKKGQMRIEWRKILTPEQMQKLDRMPMGFGMGHGHKGWGMMR